MLRSRSCCTVTRESAPARWLIVDDAPADASLKRKLHVHGKVPPEVSTPCSRSSTRCSSATSLRGFSSELAWGESSISPPVSPSSLASRETSKGSDVLAGSNAAMTPVRSELQKSDIPELLSMLSAKDKEDFSRPWFAVDCRRRYRELVQDPSKPLGVGHLRGIVKMFPCLTLDYTTEERCIAALDQDLARLHALFDSDSDGFLSEDDFANLVKFCQAWRTHFYIKKPSSPPTSATQAGYAPTSPLKVAARGILQTSSASHRPASQGSPKLKAQSSPSSPAMRRTSGFGPRMLGLEQSMCSASKVTAESPSQKRRNSTSDLPSPETLLATTDTEKVKQATRASDDYVAPSGESRIEARLGRRGSAPALLNFRTDATRGAFYSCLSGYSTMTFGGARSRSSSPALSSASSASES